jgi:flagellar biosynthetic protein FlhB
MMGNIAPKASRINPMSGITRIFGPTGWIEAGKGTLKVLLLGTIAWYWAKSRLDTMVNLGAVGLSGQIAFAWSAITSLLYHLAGGLVIIAAIDFPINWLRRIMRLRMSLQDVKDENKEAEGSPEAKSARKGRQRQIAMGAIAGAMKKAQFVITNPTHFAVAVTWDPDLAPAPWCWPRVAAKRRWRSANWRPKTTCPASRSRRWPARFITPRASGR